MTGGNGSEYSKLVVCYFYASFQGKGDDPHACGIEEDNSMLFLLITFALSLDVVGALVLSIVLRGRLGPPDFLLSFHLIERN